MKKADAQLTVTLNTTDRGGRDGPTAPDRFGCVMVTDRGNWDVRFWLDGALTPGTTKTVDASFLSPYEVLSFLKKGQRFALWEGKVIGSVRVERVLREPVSS